MNVYVLSGSQNSETVITGKHHADEYQNYHKQTYETRDENIMKRVW